MEASEPLHFDGLGVYSPYGSPSPRGFGPEVGDYAPRLTGLPDAFLNLWGIVRWLLAFLAVTVAHAVLYFLAPNADLPFEWVTLGGLSATVLMFISSAALRLYAANFGHYD